MMNLKKEGEQTLNSEVDSTLRGSADIVMLHQKGSSKK